MTLRKSLLALPFLLGSTAMVHAADKAAIIDNYANIAQAGYEDSLTLAKALKGAVEALIAAPTEANLQAAKDAWLAARVPYQQTEAFRFGNPTVDDWEGKVNAWPLDGRSDRLRQGRCLVGREPLCHRQCDRHAETVDRLGDDRRVRDYPGPSGKPA